MSGVVTITSDKDVSSLATLFANLRPEGVREARSHVGYSKREFILETGGEGVFSESTSHPVARERVSPNTIFVIFGFVVVYHKFH